MAESNEQVWFWLCPRCGAVGVSPLDKNMPWEEVVPHIKATHDRFSLGSLGGICTGEPWIQIPEAIGSERIAFRFKVTKKKLVRQPLGPRSTVRFRDLPPEVIGKAVDLCGGHNVMAPEALLEAGVPPDLVRDYTRVYASDFSGPATGWIFDSAGVPIAELEGVYGLDLLWAIAGDLGVAESAGPYGGRGFQARALQKAIRDVIGQLGTVLPFMPPTFKPEE